MKSIGIKQFRHEGCLSYVVFDRPSGAAVVIDPLAEAIEDYREYLAEHKLKPLIALDTHTHADHFSGSHFFAREYGVPIGMSEKTRSERVTRKLRHGEWIEIGSIRLQALATPGHTPDSMSFYMLGLVFTGDTLFIGSSGRTDFPGADPAEQWKSLHEVLGALPDDTVMMPGHDYNDLLFSTMGVEKKKNPHWLVPSCEQFAAMKKAETIVTVTDEVRKRIEFNSKKSPQESPQTNVGAATACGVAMQGAIRVVSISVDKYATKLKENSEKTAFIDVREEDEFVDGHMPGVQNIPLSELALHMSELTQAKRVYLSCLSGRRSGLATQTLNYLGLTDVVNVTGGFRAWQSSGFEVTR